MNMLPESAAFRDRLRRILRPRTKWGRVTLWTGGLSVFLIALRWLTGSPSEPKVSGWATFFIIIFAFCALKLTFRWARLKVMWRLRHRLIVAYVFAGIIPILLLMLIAGVASYLCAWQFASYIATSDLESTLQHLDASNNALAAQLRTLERAGNLNEQSAGEFTAVSGENFPQRTVTVWQGKNGFLLSADGKPLKTPPLQVPDSIKGNFAGFVLDGGSLHLRAVKRYDEGGLTLMTISNVPITRELLRSASSRLGTVSLRPLDQHGQIQISTEKKESAASNVVETGRISPALNRFDQTFHVFSAFNAVDWKTGDSQIAAISIVTRPSMLLSTLFAALGDEAKVLWYIVLTIALLFGLMELAALYVGIRISRSITLAVSELYDATQHVNRGDLTHRIQIRKRDQMASLEESFNSMTDSLVKLVAEQQQKQRLESELALAYEVQDLLFPHQSTELASLETYGVCRPARSVSGDYYDFIPLSGDGLVLAVGDISGKGISAALLMATVHAYVRAYSQVSERKAPLAAPGGGAFSKEDCRVRYGGNGADQLQLSPAMMMAALNNQLFRSTPPEKYATMFLGCYDAAMRQLRYCDAGHLPPVVLNGNGKVSRLEISGTVAGLFDGVAYDEFTLAMQPGDLFVAFSDGVTEPENDSGEFGEERLIALLQEHRKQPLSQIGSFITEAVAEWIGDAEQPDDVTVVLARAR
jgi:sigma-B regulation protein RsbU (phosphoserine phosphatase)